ncbi:MAG: hypothetical protein CMH83_02845 [Nocardioides sp.]|nr:hypothetical protein [Nocardioides sp.]
MAHPLTRSQPASSPDHALARAVLACPADAELTLEGPVTSLEDLLTGATLTDDDGTPELRCAVGSPLDQVGASGPRVLLRLCSGLGAPRSSDRDLRLLLGGVLRRTGVVSCACCPEVQRRLQVDLDLVVLTDREGLPRPRLDPAHFASPRHQLNRGYLQRAAEHLGHGHLTDLRTTAAAVARLHDVADVLGAGVARLTTTELELTWVTAQGGDHVVLPLARPARDPQDLGNLVADALAVAAR